MLPLLSKNSIRAELSSGKYSMLTTLPPPLWGFPNKFFKLSSSTPGGRFSTLIVFVTSRSLGESWSSFTEWWLAQSSTNFMISTNQNQSIRKLWLYLYIIQKKRWILIEIRERAKHWIFRLKSLIPPWEFTSLKLQLSEWRTYEGLAWITVTELCPLGGPLHPSLTLSPECSLYNTNLLIPLLCRAFQWLPITCRHKFTAIAGLTVPLAIWLQTNLQASPLVISCYSFYFPCCHKNQWLFWKLYSLWKLHSLLPLYTQFSVPDMPFSNFLFWSYSSFKTQPNYLFPINKYWWWAHDVPGTVPGSGDRMMNITSPCNFAIQEGGKASKVPIVGSNEVGRLILGIRQGFPE